MSFLNPVTAFKKTIKFDPIGNKLFGEKKKKAPVPAADPAATARRTSTGAASGLLAGTKMLL